MFTKMFSCALTLYALISSASAYADDSVATAALNLQEPVPPSVFMQQLSFGVLDKECWSATNQVVLELEDGTVVLRHIDRLFNEVNIVFGGDQRVLRPPTLVPDGRWYFCFEVFATPNDFGIYEPVVKTHLVIPPDMSS